MDIGGIEWVGFRLNVVVKGRGSRDPLKSTGAYRVSRLGAEVRPPEALERIHALPIEMPPSIVSAPPYSK